MLSFNYNTTGVTVELGELVDSGVDIWAFTYPTPAQEVEYNGKVAKVPFSKEALEQKIVDHYRFRQIGQETVGRWLHYFRTRMREIMPYYVQLYEFEAKWWNIEDPLESYNLTETFDQATDNTGTDSGSNTTQASGSESVTGANSSEQTGSNSKNGTVTDASSNNTTTKFSDTPQGSIENLESYMTTATKVEGSENKNQTVTETGTTSEKVTGTTTQSTQDSNSASGTFSQTSRDSGTVRHTLTRRGNIGVQPLGSEVKNIREAFINIDLMVINELKDLFLQVY